MHLHPQRRKLIKNLMSVKHVPKAVCEISVNIRGGGGGGRRGEVGGGDPTDGYSIPII